MQKDNGFTLMEVMVAVGILVTGLLAVVTLLLNSAEANRRIPQRTLANLLNEEALEGSRAKANADYLRNDDFEYYDGSVADNCINTGSCVFGFEETCINSTCDGFSAQPGCDTRRPQIVPATGGYYYIFYDENIGYFQLHDVKAACNSKRTGMERKIQTNVNVTPPGAVQICSSISFGDGSSETLCEELSDPRYGP